MSWEATKWVMDNSHHKGSPLLVMILIANDVNHEGEGYFSTVERLAERSRLHPRTVKRILRTLERSSELVAVRRGIGQTPTFWRLPGVTEAAKTDTTRGGKMPPQRWQDATSGVASCHLRGGKMPPKSSGVNTGISVLNIRSTQHQQVLGAADPQAPESQDHNCPERLRAFLFEPPIHIDSRGADRLWFQCVTAWPEVTAEDVITLCGEKLRTARNIKNPGGLVMTTIPAAVVSLRLAMDRPRHELGHADTPKNST